MKYKLTVGNFCAALLLSLSLITLLDSPGANETMGGSYGIGLVVLILVADFILQLIIKKPRVLNLIELITIAAFIIIGSMH